jgi:hypothetical protein
VALLMSKLKDILKGNLDDRVVYYIYSILDEIINDILKWTSISVNKFQSERPVIDKRVLIAAIHTDRVSKFLYIFIKLLFFDAILGFI